MPIHTMLETTPQIIEAEGVPETYADAAFFRHTGEMVRVLFCCRRSSGLVTLVNRVHMPLSGFLNARACVAHAFDKLVLLH